MRRGLIALLCFVIAGCGGGGSGGSNIGTNFRVPDVVGQTQANASSAIVAAGLTVGTISTSTSLTVAAGNVISQSPAAGSSVPPNTAVNLVVSTGASAAVPNVVGQTQGTATSMITANGFAAGTVTLANSATVPTGRVISQNPAAGASATAGSPVSLTVSAYPAGFGIPTRPALATFTLPTSGGGGSGVFDAVEAFPNLSLGDALIMTGIPGETRLVVANQSGKVLAFAPSAGVSATRTIVDLASKIVAGGERGLLGLALDPNFATNRYFYVDYTRQSDGATVIARYTWVGGGTDAASLSSEKVILVIPQPAANHNGGMIAFGPNDGYLYIAMGDGGGANDQFGNAQNMATLLGKILRIDVHPANDATPYNVPADNPFVSRSGARGEIWALGLRNPFRFSFDRGGSGRLWAGDVGQDQTEEIDIITKGGNYGWPRFEGSTLYQSGTALASGTTHTPPVYEYDHPHGFSVIGGYVYRGTQIASLIGKYLYTDYFNGIVSSLAYDGTNPPINTDLATVPSPAGFGEDNNGEVYIVSQTDGLFQLTETGGGGSGPALLSQTGLFTDLATLTPAAGLIEYDLNTPFWSDGALKRRWVAVPANLKVTFSSTGSWTFPVGTVIVKHFEMEMIDGDPNSARRLETRILTRTSTGWEGFTYRWNAGETDADLLATGATEVLTINAGTGNQRTQTYEYPSRTDCLQCHTSAAGFALGLSTRQLNKDFDYGAVTDNELRALDHIGYFSSGIGTASQYGAYPAIDDTAFAVATRARAYLAVNCAQCHRPGGPTNVNLDFRFDTADASMNAINVAPAQGDLGIGSAARIIAPGAKANSVLWQRMQRLDGTRMPPLASHRVDQTAVTVIGSWIDSLP